MSQENPKAFISHASEDKARFVLPFAKKLLENGVDAWVDKWEMKLGDSLIHKIFEEGIKDSNIFIVVLSKFSVDKAWVKEELESAVYKKIEGKIRLIPIVIDMDVTIPQSIKHLLRKPITDLNNYEEEFKEIIMSIYGTSSKPELGEPPGFVTGAENVPGFQESDAKMLKIAGEIVCQKDNIGRTVGVQQVIEQLLPLGLSKESVLNSLEFLASQGYWEIVRLRSIEMSPITFTDYGFVRYCEIFIKDFEAISKEVASCIYNDNLKSSGQIASKLGRKLVIVNSLVAHFKNDGYITIVNEFGRAGAMISGITATGQRYFEGILGG